MKKLLLSGALFLCLQAFGQVPQKMSYQSIVRNASGSLITNSAIGMKVSILEGSASGNAVYVETLSGTTNANGLASFQIGTGTVVSGSFAAIDWSTGNYFVKIDTDPTGGTNYTISGVSQFLSVPYALYAGTSGTPGPQGPAGNDGATGPMGPQGPQGIQGPAGNDGATGPQGPIGLTGATGATGPQGPAGNDGATGPMGPQGLQGIQGPAGNDGATGPQGPIGLTGANGSDGKSVLNGTTNPLAATGTNGDFYINTATNFLFGPKTAGAWPTGVSLVGPTGATGAQGAIGPQGPIGLTGATGATGIGYGGTSSSAKTISLGSKTFAVPAGLAYIPGERIRFVDPTNSANFLEGTITSYSTTSMVVNIDNNGGSGTISSWNLCVGGNLGTTGATGAQGPAGTNGVGVPTGGTTGQVLAKVDGTNYNTQWVTPGGSGSTLELIANKVGGSSETLPVATSITATTIVFNNVINAPVLGSYNNTTGVFTVGAAGTYLVQVKLLCNDASTPSQTVPPFLSLLKNNATYGSTGADAYYGDYPTIHNVLPTGIRGQGSLIKVVQLAAGDTFKIVAVSANSSTAAQPTSTVAGSNITIVKL